MSDRHQDLELAVPPQRAREVVREAVAQIGWRCVEDEDGSLVVREGAGLLADHWPIGIKVSIETVGERRSALRMWGRQGGFGPFIAEQLKEAMEEFAAAVRRVAVKSPSSV